MIEQYTDFLYQYSYIGIAFVIIALCTAIARFKVFV